MVNSLKKGKDGEREFCKWLENNLSINATRNLDQVRDGGADIITNDFIFEVKRRQVLDLKSWWLQVKIAHGKNKNDNLIPVVAYRQNNKKWQFLISAKFIGLENGYIQLEENIFKKWACEIVNRII